MQDDESSGKDDKSELNQSMQDEEDSSKKEDLQTYTFDDAFAFFDDEMDNEIKQEKQIEAE